MSAFNQTCAVEQTAPTEGNVGLKVLWTSNPGPTPTTPPVTVPEPEGGDEG